MIDLYYWPTPNGHKITLMLEECGFDYRIHPVDITKGAQFAPDFLKFSPNNKMPAIIDLDPEDAGDPLSVFESGAILRYLAAKADKFGGTTPRERIVVDEWLFWQVGGLGPMAGQMSHFTRFAPKKVPYAITRYTDETRRLNEVLDRRLATQRFVAGENYSIADMASYPWVLVWEKYGPAPTMAGLDNVARWIAEIAARPATIAAYAKADAIDLPPPPPAPAN